MSFNEAAAREMATKCGFTDPKEVEAFVEYSRKWDAETAPFLEALRQSRILTAADYAVTIGPCDD